MTIDLTQKKSDILESIRDGFFVLDKNWRILYVNSSAGTIWHVEPEKVIGKNFWKIFPGLKGTIVEEDFRRGMKSKEVRRFETKGVYTDGLYEAKVFPSTQGISVLLSDIAENRKADIALRKSEERYRQLFDSMTELFFVTEPVHDKNNKLVDFVYVEVNPAFLRSIGKTMESVIGKQSSELFGFVDDLWLGLVNEVEQTLRPAHVDSLSKVTGRYYHVHAWMLTGKQVGILCEDITERKALEVQLQDNARMAAIGQTARMVGHDIRNPLQAIAGDLYLIDSEVASLPNDETKESLQESVNSIQDNLLYIAKIVEDLQDYARTQRPNLEKTEINRVIGDVMQLVNVSSNHQVVIDIQKGFPEIVADPSMLKRALANLVNNAIQAMPDGGQLTIKACQNGTQVFISVEDTGMGIPEEIKPKLFEPMVTTKAKGQGLGLAVVKRLVEAQGGSITFESEEGKGTKFKIQMPLNP